MSTFLFLKNSPITLSQKMDLEHEKVIARSRDFRASVNFSNAEKPHPSSRKTFMELDKAREMARKSICGPLMVFFWHPRLNLLLSC